MPGVKFDDEIDSPGFDRLHHKDMMADDPRRRTDGIDRVLGGDYEGLGMGIEGGSLELQDLSRVKDSRALRQLQQEEEDRKAEQLEAEKAREREERD